MNRDDEIESGENGGEAIDENADRHGDNPAVGVGAAVGSIERPTGIDTAEENGSQRKQPSEHEDVPTDQVERGNAMSRAPIMIGIRKFPRTLGIEGIKKNQTMITPCKVKSLL